MMEQSGFHSSTRTPWLGALVASLLILSGCGGGGQSGAESTVAPANDSSAVGKSVIDRGVAFTASGIGTDGQTYRINYSVLPLGNVQYQGETRASTVTSVTVFRNGAFVGTDRRTAFFDPSTGQALDHTGKATADVGSTDTWRTEQGTDGRSWACVDAVLAPTDSQDSGLPGSRCFEVGEQGLITGRFRGHLSLPDANGLEVQFVGSGRYTGSGA